eukprot:Rhum_TRINITY_DN15243_c0_g1::Rhum_TRINITY_DN15243_c0_g1_i3::g.145975::m.145975
MVSGQFGSGSADVAQLAGDKKRSKKKDREQSTRLASSSADSTEEEEDAKADDDNYAPAALWVETSASALEESEDLTPQQRRAREVAGGYTKVGGQKVNDSAVWSKANGDVHLFCNKEGEWGFSFSRDEMVAGVVRCSVRSAAEHSGKAQPHLVPAWIVVVEGKEAEATTLSIIPNPNRETNIEQLLVFCVHDTLKFRYYRHFPYYLIFLVAMVIGACILPNGIGTFSDKSGFWVGKGVLDASNSQLLGKTTSGDQFFDWTEQVLRHLWIDSHVVNNASIANQYVQTPLLAQQGTTLDTLSTSNRELCMSTCEKRADCHSFVFSQACSICLLKDGCVDPTNATQMLPSSGGIARCADPSPFSYYDQRCSAKAGNLTLQPSVPFDSAEKKADGQAFRSYGVGLALLQQVRVEAQDCELSTTLPPYDAEKIPGKCYGRYKESRSDAPPFGVLTEEMKVVPVSDPTRPPYITDEARGVEYDGTSLYTDTSLFSSSVDTFSIPFRYNVSLPETLQGLRRAQSGKFLDEQTRLVRLNAVLYFPAHDGFFAYVSSFVEFRSVGGVQVGQRVIPFKIVNFNRARNRFVFALDVIIVLSTVIMTVSYIRNIYVKWCLKQASKMNRITVFGIWEIFELCHLVTLSIQSDKRMQMWAKGASTASDNIMETMKDQSDTTDPAIAAHNFLVHYALLTDKGNVAFSIAIIMSFLRLFKYAQFDPRVNALSETVKGAAYHLLVMTIIFLVVLVSFSLGGCILFGHALTEFRNFPTSMSYLLRCLVQATMENWNGLHNERPTVSWVFLVAYFLISWLLLLNMVLAIIAKSFATVQESMAAVATDTDDLTFLSAWATVKRTVRGYMVSRQNRRHGVHLRGRLAAHAVALELVGHDLASDQAVSLCQQIRAWSETSRRTLRTSRPDVPPSALTDARLYIRALQFRELCLSVSPPLTVSRELHRIFAAAQKQVVSGSSGRDRQDARRFALMSEKIGEMDGRVVEARARAEAAQNDQAASLAEIAALLRARSPQTNGATAAGQPTLAASNDAATGDELV